MDSIFEIMRYFKERNKKVVSSNELSDLIAVKAGAMPWTVSRYIALMLRLKLIEKTEDGPEWFLNFDRADELML